jgi:PPK2 family polyphosphate:nucleotide phosphotransferase
MLESPYRVEPGSKVKLSHWSPDDTGEFRDKAEARPIVKTHLKRLVQLQDKLYASSQYALLIVLQAMDAGGKDGAISHVFSGVNPQGCDVTSFKVPTHLEMAHDYLWRYHISCPKLGMIGIFNRSHYESVLVERVHKLVPKAVWQARYDQLNEFERMLVSEKTLILKFYLHISNDEQKRRLEARLHDKKKNWKYSSADLAERKKWDQYSEAYEDMLERCSTVEAPWFVVPSNHKWFRNWVLSDIIVRALETLDLKYPKPKENLEGVKIP